MSVFESCSMLLRYRIHADVRYQASALMRSAWNVSRHGELGERNVIGETIRASEALRRVCQLLSLHNVPERARLTNC